MKSNLSQLLNSNNANKKAKPKEIKNLISKQTFIDPPLTCDKTLAFLPSSILSEDFSKNFPKIETPKNKQHALNSGNPNLQQILNPQKLANTKTREKTQIPNTNSLAFNQMTKSERKEIPKAEKKNECKQNYNDCTINLSEITRKFDEEEIEANTMLQSLSLISEDLKNDDLSTFKNEIILNNQKSTEKGQIRDNSISNNSKFEEIESLQEHLISIVPKPKSINTSSYTSCQVDLYSNIYPIKLTKNYNLYTYFVDFQGDSEHYNTHLKKKIISKAYLDLIPTYGVYFFSGNNLYATNRIEDVKNYISIYNKVQYSVLIRPLNEFIEMKNYEDNPRNKSLFKNILELIYKDILKANPEVKMSKNMCGKKMTEKIVYTNRNKVLIIPAFTTKIMLLEAGIFFNADNKNKILNGEDCFQLMKNQAKNFARLTKQDICSINENFRDKIVETKHTNQRFKIDSISFDRNPKNTSLNYDASNVEMHLYYKKLYGITLEEKQPLMLLKHPSNRRANSGRYYPSQLCFLSGLTDQMTADNKLMSNISGKTKLNPTEKVEEIDSILDLLYQDQNKVTKEGIKLPSSLQKMKDYGIEFLRKDENSFRGLIMKPPKMLGFNNQIITSLSKPFKILDPKEINFICLYHELYTKDKVNLEKLISTAGAAYGIKIGRSDYVKMNTEDIDEWINVIKEKYKTKAYNMVLILLDDYLELEGFYSPLKRNSIEELGYPMQVILTQSLQRNAMSVVTGILLQCNSKIGGSLFRIEIPQEIKEKDLMIIGIDISVIKGQNKLNVAMCATINKEFTEYRLDKKSIDILENNAFNSMLSLNISGFVEEAVAEYFKKNKCFPKGIIFYRQGVSKEQKVHLNQEVLQIENLLSGKNPALSTNDIFKNNPIPYYYVLVNKKTSLKFFQKEQNYGSNIYSNPDSGLLIVNDLVEKDIFEFYIQPQKVNQGTATPTNFHVAYGNLNIPSYIPKITYDLCYMYSNWRGPVRVPAPLKNAEKLAKTEHNLHINSKNKLYHL